MASAGKTKFEPKTCSSCCGPQLDGATSCCCCKCDHETYAVRHAPDRWRAPSLFQRSEGIGTPAPTLLFLHIRIRYSMAHVAAPEVLPVEPSLDIVNRRADSDLSSLDDVLKDDKLKDEYGLRSETSSLYDRASAGPLAPSDVQPYTAGAAILHFLHIRRRPKDYDLDAVSLPPSGFSRLSSPSSPFPTSSTGRHTRECIRRTSRYALRPKRQVRKQGRLRSGFPLDEARRARPTTQDRPQNLPLGVNNVHRTGHRPR